MKQGWLLFVKFDQILQITGENKQGWLNSVPSIPSSGCYREMTLVERYKFKICEIRYNKWKDKINNDKRLSDILKFKNMGKRYSMNCSNEKI